MSRVMLNGLSIICTPHSPKAPFSEHSTSRTVALDPAPTLEMIPPGIRQANFSEGLFHI